MRVNKWIPSPGCLIDWDIDEILSRPSCDVHPSMFEVCQKCGATNYDDWGWVLNGEPVLDEGLDNLDHKCWEHAKEGENLTQAWDRMLLIKRDDYHYTDVLDSIRDRGFLRPLSAWPNTYDEQLQFGDGHHRLAAAIDLGMKTVPVKVYDRMVIARDSGSWDYDSPIETLAELESKLRL